MKAVILAGGRGSRLSEETDLKPKPMVEIGGKPILWHLMKHLSTHGVDDFVICLGYLGYVIKEYFANYVLHSSDVTFDMRTGEIEMLCLHDRALARDARRDRGGHGDGGRLKRVLPYVAGERDFVFTYGDGLERRRHHEARRVPPRAGRARDRHRRAAGRALRRAAARRDQDLRVERFSEKPRGDGAWINGGFFVARSAIGDRIAGDATAWEEEPVSSLAARRAACRLPALAASGSRWTRCATA